MRTNPRPSLDPQLPQATHQAVRVRDLTACALGGLCTLGMYAALSRTLGSPWAETGALLVVLLIVALLAATLAAKRMRRTDAKPSRALRDDLTDLPNRALLLKRLNGVIQRRQGDPKAYFAVIFVALDRFQMIRDALGQEVGDALLVALSERLLRCVRPEDTVTRLPGGTFALLLAEVNRPEDALEVAGRVERALEAPFSVAGCTLTSPVSLGILSSEEDYAAAEEVLRDADLALYRAKASGRGQHQLFSADHRASVVAAMTFERELRSAVTKGELELRYQPIVSVASAQTVGFEALVRWRHPQRGLLEPTEFLSVAERTGVIVDIDRWVLRQACAQLAAWQAHFGRPLTLSVDLSAQQLRQADFAEVAQQVLEETGFEAFRLRLEITENALVDPPREVAEVLTQLDRLGLDLHMGDFGTGHASLPALQRTPADTLKIDRSVVRELAQSPQSDRLVRTIIVAAHSLGRRVIAEGVETAAQLERLLELGCDDAQGFFFAKPLEADAAAELLTLASREAQILADADAAA